jgi:outer membrane biosynthesis protein TonB
MVSKTIILPEDKNKRKGLLVSLLIHLLILVLLILPFIRFPIPPPGQAGILVSLGVPDQGQGKDLPETQNIEKVEPKPVSEPPKAATPVVQKETQAEKKVITTEDPAAIALRKAKEDEARKKREEADKKKQVEAEAQRKAEEEARVKAEAEAKKKAEYEQAKKQYGTLLSGSGKGETGTPGNQGSPEGDPNSSNLKGVSSGSGMVGGGLDGRGVKYEPRISDNSQKVGKVVVNVCVDKSGKVITAEYTQRGSTTTDSDLRALAESSARKFVFTASSIEKQCGTITVDFKVR